MTDNDKRVYAMAREEIERQVLEELMEPGMEAKLAGADAVNAQMRGPGAPADHDAAADAWKAMLRASPLYARVHGSEKGEG